MHAKYVIDIIILLSLLIPFIWVSLFIEENKVPKKWMQKVSKTLKKGALREELGAKPGKPIPKKKLEKAAKSKNPTLKKRAVLAETFRKAAKRKEK